MCFITNNFLGCSFALSVVASEGISSRECITGVLGIREGFFYIIIRKVILT